MWRALRRPRLFAILPIAIVPPTRSHSVVMQVRFLGQSIQTERIGG